ncbi:MAG: response regulator [Planctomycetaceae bacterium]
MVKPIVMVVEDDQVDVEAVKRGLKERQLDFEVDTHPEGTTALHALKSYSEKQLGRLVVLLDINMPGMNGHQFLETVRDDPRLNRTIVFVLTTSGHPRDKAAAYDKNVAGYFVKSNLSGLLDTLADYVNSVEFPPLATNG